jgi:hypothetical protein
MKVKNAHMQAFPFIEPYEDDNIKAYHPGMTMRDEFAKAAMQALIAETGMALRHFEGVNFNGLNIVDNEGGTPTAIAEESYAMADAMMKARK